MAVLDDHADPTTVCPSMALDASVSLVRAQWTAFVFLLGLVWPAGALLIGLIAFEPISFWVPIAFGGILGFGIWMRAATCVYAIFAASGVPHTVGFACRATFGMPLLRLAWTGTLVLIGTVVGACALIVPGVWFYLRYGALAAPIVLSEELSGIPALRRARELSTGNERILFRQWFSLILALGAVWIVTFVADLLAGPLVSRVTNLVTGVAQALIFVVWRCVFYASTIGTAQRTLLVPGLRPWTAVAPFVVGAVLLLSRPFIQAFWIPSGAMLPTIAIGDHVFARKFAINLKHGDVVVFRSPIDRNTDLIKRVVALPGDEVEIRHKQLLLNGQPIAEPHAYFEDPQTLTSVRDELPAKTVPEGKFFVLGDNRDRSYDSRFYGFADLDDVIGVATWIYWSWDSDNERPRLERIGKWIR
jgi:signal peptidase I